MTEIGLGPWDPLRPAEVAGLLDGCPIAWWIAGGYAVDALVGRTESA